MSGTEWVYTLIENVTSPLDNIFSELSIVDNAALKLEGDLHAIGGASSGPIAVGEATEHAGMQAHEAGGHVEGFKDQVMGIAAGFGIITTVETLFEAVTETIKETAKEIFDVTEKMEGFDVVLKHSFQSAEMGHEAFSMLEDYTKTAPVHVDDLTQSFIDMRIKGFTPTFADLTKMGDLAATGNKSITDFAQAVEMAGMGAFKGAKQFGVLFKPVAKDTEHLTATFQGHKVVIKNTEEAIRAYMISLGGLPGVQGTAAELMEGLTGKENDLYNSTHELHLKMGELFRPAMDGWMEFKQHGVEEMMSWVEWLSENGDEVKDFFGGLATALIAGGAAWVAFNAGMLIEQGIAGGALIITNLLTAAQWALNFAMEANPVGIIIALVASLGFALYELWQHSETVRATFYGLWEGTKEVFGGIYDIIKGTLSTVFDLFKGLGEIMVGVFMIDPAMIKTGMDDALNALKDSHPIDKIMKIGADAGAAYDKGYNGEIAASENEQTTGKHKKEKYDFGKSSAITSGKATGAGETSLSSGGGSGAGGGRNIYTTIQNLAQIHITSATGTIKETLPEIQRMINETLLAGTRDFEVAISNG